MVLCVTRGTVWYCTVLEVFRWYYVLLEVQCGVLQHSVVLYGTGCIRCYYGVLKVECGTVLHKVVMYGTIWYYMAFYGTLLYGTVRSVLKFSQCTILLYTCCIVLYCATCQAMPVVMYCTCLYYV